MAATWGRGLEAAATRSQGWRGKDAAEAATDATTADGAAVRAFSLAVVRSAEGGWDGVLNPLAMCLRLRFALCFRYACRYRGRPVRPTAAAGYSDRPVRPVAAVSRPRRDMLT
jgi:hypothetical protein